MEMMYVENTENEVAINVIGEAQTDTRQPRQLMVG